MKKLDKLILGSFIGPFFLTFLVVDFILLTVNMLKYFDEIFGKGLSFWVYMELISYFVISISPMALPLAVLLSSLMTFGNLGEHFELTAIKSSGISLLRALRPIGVFVVFLTIAAYLSNNYLVPKVNLKTFSLLYDIRMKSPALDIKEGVFYSGIPNYSIKVNTKMDDVRLKDIIIYDHSDGQGNTNIILADSGRMEPFYNDSYLSLTLYNGTSYQEAPGQQDIYQKPVAFTRTHFSENQIIFNLESFQLNRTPEDLWSTNRAILNISQLREGLDSMAFEVNQIVYYNYLNTESSYSFYTRGRKLVPPTDIADKKAAYDKIKEQKAAKMSKQRKDSLDLSSKPIIFSETEVNANVSFDSAIADLNADSTGNVIMPVNNQNLIQESIASSKGTSPGEIKKADSVSLSPFPKGSKRLVNTQLQDSLMKSRLDSIIQFGNYRPRAATVGLNNARTIKNNYSNKLNQIDSLEREYRRFQIAWYQKYTTAFACFVMFMIGAPLGAIIKKGGLGMPVLVSIIFFIIYYMLTITGEKWAKEGITDAVLGTWFSNIVLLPFGLFFLKQARRDARLFELDIYLEFFQKINGFFRRK